jgi:hypothetical protein
VGERVSTFQRHSHLGHPTLKSVRRVLYRFQLPVASPKDYIVCTACLGAKIKQLHFSLSLASGTYPLALIYIDVWGPASVISRSSFKYYVMFLDAYSKYTWLYLFHAKVMSVLFS